MKDELLEVLNVNKDDIDNTNTLFDSLDTDLAKDPIPQSEIDTNKILKDVIDEEDPESLNFPIGTVAPCKTQLLIYKDDNDAIATDTYVDPGASANFIHPDIIKNIPNVKYVDPREHFAGAIVGQPDKVVQFDVKPPGADNYITLCAFIPKV